MVERSIDRSEIYLADEVWLCGTGVQIVTVTQIDHRPIGSGAMGPVVEQLRQVYFSVVRGQNISTAAWCQPVY